MIINKIRQVSRKFLIHNTKLNIDFAYTEQNQILLVGWLVLRESEERSLNARNCVIGKLNYLRPDVQARYNIQSEEQCFGFLAVVTNFSDNPDNLVLEIGGKKFPLSKQRYVKVGHINEIIAHAGPDPEKACKFLKANGVDVETTTSPDPSKPVRRLDKDVEKIKNALEPVNVHVPGFVEECANSVLPKIQRIWRGRQSKENNAQIKRFGEVQPSPTLSIIVPLYGRYDLMQHQIAHFAIDASMKNVELIYVLDDPPLSHEVSVTAHGLFETFDLPFTLVLSEHNLGFSGANNLGVSVASGEHILLLNSDIIPTETGWVDTYLAQFEGLDDCGILGATLVYEDNTVQHAGMEFRQDSSYPGIWMNHHPYKGWPLSLIGKQGVSKVQLTTGASMLMKRALFNELEGFDPMYILGDFEDSDLCLKCINMGMNIYVSNDVVMYHLERLSQDLVDMGDWKFKLTLANSVYQMTKWRALIEKVVA